MRRLWVIFSGILCLGLLAPLPAPANAADGPVAMLTSAATDDSSCPDDCCDGCPEPMQCLTGCAMAVLPNMHSEVRRTRGAPGEAGEIARLRPANPHPETPPPRRMT